MVSSCLLDLMLIANVKNTGLQVALLLRNVENYRRLPISKPIKLIIR